MRQLRGVNLGGWLVVERWMTPSLFEGMDAVDHFTLAQTSEGKKRIRQHLKTFMREEDWRWLKRQGISIVRLPIGYWSLDGDGPYEPCVDRLDWAFRMASKYNIELLLCLHGAPGSQNGHNHSGRTGGAKWYGDKRYREQTVDILVRVANRYRSQPKFWGLELLNEPKKGLFQWKLRSFYKQAYQELSQILSPSVRIIFHDAFTPRLMNGAIKTTKLPVVMDIHWYHFGYWARRHASLEHYYRVIERRARLLKRLSRRQPIIIGEWSGALCWELLEKYPASMRHDLELDHVRQQLGTYREAAAWFYWNYKIEGGGTWSLRSLIDDDGFGIGQ